MITEVCQHIIDGINISHGFKRVDDCSRPTKTTSKNFVRLELIDLFFFLSLYDTRHTLCQKFIVVC